MPIYMEHLLAVLNLPDFQRSCHHRLDLQNMCGEQSVTQGTHPLFPLFFLYPENTLNDKIKLCCHDYIDSKLK